MAATTADFTDLVESGAGVYFGTNVTEGQWPKIARAVRGLGAFFAQKVSSGTEPADILTGLIFGDGTNFNEWRLFVSGTDLLIQENTGTEGTPVWTTRNTFSTGTGFTSSFDIDTLPSATPVLADEFAFSDSGTESRATLTALNAILDHDALINFVANEHLDWTSASVGTIDATNLPATVAFLATNQEFTKAQAIEEETVTPSGNAFTLDFDESNLHEITLDQNITSVTITNTGTKPGSHTVIMKQNGTGGFTVTGWPAAVNWVLGTAPTISSSPSAVDLINIIVGSDGQMYGTVAQDFS